MEARWAVHTLPLQLYNQVQLPCCRGDSSLTSEELSDKFYSNDKL